MRDSPLLFGIVCARYPCPAGPAATEPGCLRDRRAMACPNLVQSPPLRFHPHVGVPGRPSRVKRGHDHCDLDSRGDYAVSHSLSARRAFDRLRNSSLASKYEHVRLIHIIRVGGYECPAGGSNSGQGENQSFLVRRKPVRIRKDVRPSQRDCLRCDFKTVDDKGSIFDCHRPAFYQRQKPRIAC